jgi:peptide/nickel transport system substrate-binding protein
VLKSELAQVGITLNVRRVDFDTWLDQVYENKQFDMSMVNHTETRDFGNWANLNYYFGYNNSMVQRLYAELLATTDQLVKDTKLAQAARIVSDDAAAEWLYTGTTTTAIRNGVTGFPTSSTTTRLNLSGLAVN